MRIVVADPASLVRSGCRHMLCNDFPGCEALEATSLPEVMRTLRLAVPDVLIIDPGIAGCDGAISMHQLRRENPTLPIIVLANDSVPVVVTTYLRPGTGRSGLRRRRMRPSVSLTATMVSAADGSTTLTAP